MVGSVKQGSLTKQVTGSGKSQAGWGSLLGSLQPDLLCCSHSLSLSTQLEEELKVRIEAWEREHEEAFLVNGQRFMEYVSEQWQLHRLEKEREKQERVSAELNRVKSHQEGARCVLHCHWDRPFPTA